MSAAQPQSKRAPQLHEVLAVESDLESQSAKIMNEAIATFTKKASHFIGYHKWLVMFDESRKIEEQGAEDHKEIVDTVKGKVNHVWQHFGRYLDALGQKERTNQDARADLVVDGKVIAEALPATQLLGLESRLKKLRDVYSAVPTHQPGFEWVPDEARGKEVFKTANVATSTKSEKAMRHKVLVEPTEYHPAQVENWSENVAVGVFKTEHWTSMVSPAKKAEWLGRLDKLIRAVKKARQRANTAPIVSNKVSSALRQYIHAED